MNTPPMYSARVWLFWTLGVPVALLSIGVLLVTVTDVADLPFDNPQLWWLGAIAPIGGACYAYGLYRKKRAVAAFAGQDLTPLLAEGFSQSRQAARSGFLVVASVLVVAGILGPRWGIYMEEFRAYGVDVVVAMDVSRSMLADDVEPSRLERAKREVRQQLIERAALRHANRFGLVAFAGSSSLKVPLTTDYLAFRSQLESLNLTSAPRGGTAIADAITKAADLFETSSQEATRVLLLLTDGEDHEGDPIEAARQAYEDHGVRVYTVGVGDPSRSAGAQVPADQSAPNKPLLYDGQIVFSKLNVDALRNAAKVGGGRYAAVQDFHAIVNAVASLKKSELTVEQRQRHVPRYQWFLAAALCILTIEPLTRSRVKKKADVMRRSWEVSAS